MTAFEAGLRKTLARMGISAVASYVGGALIDTLDLAPEVVARCFPTAAAWPGRVTFAELADRQLRRREAALAIPAPPPGREPRMPDPGFARFRGDGEAHLFAPRIVGEIQAIADTAASEPLETQLGRYRDALRGRAPTGRSRAMSFACAVQQPPPRSRRSSRRARSCAASSSPR